MLTPIYNHLIDLLAPPKCGLDINLSQAMVFCSAMLSLNRVLFNGLAARGVGEKVIHQKSGAGPLCCACSCMDGMAVSALGQELLPCMFSEALLLLLEMANLYSNVCQYQPQLLKQRDFIVL